MNADDAFRRAQAARLEVGASHTTLRREVDVIMNSIEGAAAAGKMSLHVARLSTSARDYFEALGFRVIDLYDAKDVACIGWWVDI